MLGLCSQLSTKWTQVLTLTQASKDIGMAPSFLYPFTSEGQFHLPIALPSINAFFNFTLPLANTSEV